MRRREDGSPERAGAGSVQRSQCAHDPERRRRIEGSPLDALRPSTHCRSLRTAPSEVAGRLLGANGTTPSLDSLCSLPGPPTTETEAGAGGT